MSQWAAYYTGGLGWTFFPYGDRYSLIPKWKEWHSVTGNVVHPEEEQNRYELVASKDSTNVWFNVMVGDYTDPDNPIVPDVDPVFASKVTLPYGFDDVRTLQVDHIVDDVDERWTGEVVITVPLTVRKWIGPNRVANFTIDWWPDGNPDQISRFVHGTFVVR